MKGARDGSHGREYLGAKVKAEGQLFEGSRQRGREAYCCAGRASQSGGGGSLHAREVDTRGGRGLDQTPSDGKVAAGCGGKSR
jgi:hypothetical protein